MQWLKNLFRPKIQVQADIESVDVVGKVILIRYPSDVSGLSAEDFQGLGSQLIRKGALAVAIIDTDLTVEAADIETLERLVAKAKERLNANSNSPLQ